VERAAGALCRLDSEVENWRHGRCKDIELEVVIRYLLDGELRNESMTVIKSV
jgi:hypothetical protein